MYVLNRSNTQGLLYEPLTQDQIKKSIVMYYIVQTVSSIYELFTSMHLLITLLSLDILNFTWSPKKFHNVTKILDISYQQSFMIWWNLRLTPWDWTMYPNDPIGQGAPYLESSFVTPEVSLKLLEISWLQDFVGWNNIRTDGQMDKQIFLSKCISDDGM